MIPRPLAAIATLALLLTLAACVPPQKPDPDPTPTETAAPLWTTDEEALAAATAAYQAYLDVAGEIAADGGRNPERIEPYVTAERYEEELAEFDLMLAVGQRASGGGSASRTTLQSAAQDAISIYACWDRRAIRFFDSNGRDITDATINTVVPRQVLLRVTDRVLVLEEVATWQGSSFCL